MKLLPFFIAASVALTINVAQAGVIIGGTRVIYNGDKKETSISVKNPDKYSYLIQSWVDSNGHEKAPFIITPPLFRLGATEDNALRIVRTGGKLAEDRESMYWMNIKTIPATEKQDNVNTLQIAIKTRLKLIYRPQALTASPESVANKLTWQRSGQRLNVTNPTPYYMNFSQVKVGGSVVKDATYVAPMSSAAFTLPAGANGDVGWKIISDYGAAGNEYHAHL
ncbi:fimbria/pilus periplasmic chaperone [[Enterobacter] lignolyticus]|uniref:Long polar fimbrial chaperone LpfB n=1 Tax=[Enterobacter] lignolyticus TaxID=1334193 RepID=A0A806X4Z3_9ENTR|nr:fimbria/pilus periplasmic chaperone [[Enterobacter] lignolyticus]ALR76375.1 long polar fimbrial chaperone LpfB [[Enterobacter] lignolyticus]